MKYINYLFLILCGSLILACSSEETTEEGAADKVVAVPVDADQVPESIKTMFSTQNPELEDVAWKQVGDRFEAEYSEEGMEREITYDSAGNILASEIQISPDDLPAAIKDYMAANMGEYSIGEAEIALLEKGTFYEVEITTNGEEKELVFDVTGNLHNPTDEDDSEDEGSEEGSKD